MDERLAGAPDEAVVRRRYRQLRAIRRFEERVLAAFDDGVLTGTTHACVGQEANAVAIAEALGDDDHVFSNHRCHGHYLARTWDVAGLWGELTGRPDGVCGGVGGSQHLSAPGFRSNGVQGGIVPAAAGIALSRALSGRDGLSVVFCGDGTFGEGVVYETLNIAALWRLPLLVVVEDNGWAQSTPAALNRAGDLPARIAAFGIPVDDVDSTDVEILATASARAVATTRAGGPAALVIRTYRLCHHSKNDDARPADEVSARWAFDPVAIQAGRLDGAARLQIDGEVEAALAETMGSVPAAVAA